MRRKFNMAENSVAKLLFAADFAAKKHLGQKRKDGFEAYINHPIEVANLLANVGEVSDEETLIAALLHDTLEDTDTTADELINLFGERVYNYVAEVTDDKSLPQNQRKKLQIQHAPYLSAAAKQIKLADKISNIHDIMNNPPQNWSNERRLEYLDWAKKVVEGLRGVNKKLEDYFDKLASEAEMRIKSNG